MYCNANSKVCIENCFSDSSCVNVGVHHSSVLSRLPFIMAIDALSQEFRTECLWELLYAYDLVIIAESVEELCQTSREQTSRECKSQVCQLLRSC